MQPPHPGPMPERLSLPDALAYFALDLPRASECDLARTLCEIHAREPSPLTDALAPLLRAELARRQEATSA